MGLPPPSIKPHAGDDPFVFVSYSRKDLDIVRPVIESLVRRGVRVWWDDGLHPGDDYAVKIEHRVEQCTALLVFLSTNAVAKKAQNWVLQETKTAAELGKELVPILCDGSKLPLEWRSLVGHLQLLQLARHSPADIATEVLKLASVRKAQNVAADEPAPPPRAREVDPDATPITPARTLPAWAQTVLRLLGELRSALRAKAEAEIDEFGGPDGPPPSVDFSVIDEPADDAPDLCLPLELDTDSHFKPCVELLQKGRELDCMTTPFARRLNVAMELIRRFPTARDPKLANALELTHLINLVSVLRLHTEVHEAPDPAICHLVTSVATIVRDPGDMTGFSTAARELHDLLCLSMDCLEFEIHLMANPPGATELKAAAMRGALAYGQEWRDRLERFISSQDATHYCVSKGFEAPGDAETSAVGLYEFTRFWEHAAWLRVAAGFLRDPTATLDDADMPPRRVHGRERPELLEAFASGLVARGCWRVIEVLRQVDLPRTYLQSYQLDSLLKDATRPIKSCVRSDHPWHHPPCCTNPRRLLALVGDSSAGRSRHSVDGSALAGLIVAALDGPEFTPLEVARLQNAAEICAQTCLRGGKRGRRYWTPGSDTENRTTKAVLWMHLVTVLNQETNNLRDVFLVASASDPHFTALEAGARLLQRFVGNETARRMLDTAADRLRAGKILPGRVHLRFLSSSAADQKVVADKLKEQWFLLENDLDELLGSDH